MSPIRHSRRDPTRTHQANVKSAMRRKLSHRGRPNVIRGALGVLLLALLGRSGTASPLAPSHGLSPRNNANVLTPSCPKYPVSKDGRCGKLFGELARDLACSRL